MDAGRVQGTQSYKVDGASQAWDEPLPGLRACVVRVDGRGTPGPCEFHGAKPRAAARALLLCLPPHRFGGIASRFVLRRRNACSAPKALSNYQRADLVS